MVVKLVVAEPVSKVHSWAMCAGAEVVNLLSEPLLHDDQLAPPDPPVEYKSLEDMERADAEMHAWEERHFPNLYAKDADAYQRYLSQPYLAALVLGTTGWSGKHVATGELWHCTVNDLTEEGKTLYESLQRLYPGCTLHLLTFLDT